MQSSPDSNNFARQRRALGRFQTFGVRGCKNGMWVAQGVEHLRNHLFVGTKQGVKQGVAEKMRCKTV